MALSINGNRIGNARRIEKLDFQDHLKTTWEREQEAKREALQKEDWLAYQELIELDPEGGEAWFDDDANIPERGNTRERINLVRARCAFLREQAKKSLGDMTPEEQTVWFKSVLEQSFNV